MKKKKKKKKAIISKKAELIKKVKDNIAFPVVASMYSPLTYIAKDERFEGPCPFCCGSKNKFTVDQENGFYYCFDCKDGGDLFMFVMKINDIDFMKAMAILALIADIKMDCFDISDYDY